MNWKQRKGNINWTYSGNKHKSQQSGLGMSVTALSWFTRRQQYQDRFVNQSQMSARSAQQQLSARYFIDMVNMKVSMTLSANSPGTI